MYHTTEAFNESVLGDNRKFFSKIKIDETEITDGIITIKHTMQSASSGYIEVGGAISSYVEIEMQKPNIGSMENEEIEVSIGIELENSDIEWVPLGIFNVQNPEINNGIAKFTAYDRMQSELSGAYFSDLNYPADAKSVLSEISQKTGVPVNVSGLSDGVYIYERTVISDNGIDDNGNIIKITTNEKPFNGYSYREAVGYIAMLYCKFAVVDRYGTIEFRWYDDLDYEIGTDRYYDDLKTPEVIFQIEKISCSGYDQTFYAGSGIENLKLSNPVMTQERLNYIYDKIKGLRFLPASASFFGDIRLDTGDIVTVNSKDGNIIKVPIMNIIQEYDGGLLTFIQSYGGTNEKTQIKGVVLDRLDRTYTELFLVKEIVGKKANFEYVYALTGEFDKLSAKQADFENVTATNFLALNARIDIVEAKNITTENLKAKVAELGYLSSESADIKYALITDLKSVTAKIDDLTAKTITTDNLASETAKLGYASISRLEASEAKIGYLETDKLNLKDLQAEIAKLGYLTVENADIEYAKINFENVTGQVVGTSLIIDGSITDAKILTVSANKLTAGVIDAAKITVKNLNADNIVVGTINGKLIGANSVDLDRLSEEVPTKQYLDAIKDGLQNQIDKSIQTYSVSEIPTLYNSPADDWNIDDYPKHIGDLCYIKDSSGLSDGSVYRFEGEKYSITDGNEYLVDENGKQLYAHSYGWILIENAQLTEAIKKLEEADSSITELKYFSSETESWKTKADDEIGSLITRTTKIETTLGDKVDIKVFNEVRQTAESNTSSITKMEEVVKAKADGSTVQEISNSVNEVRQTAGENVIRISELGEKVSGIKVGGRNLLRNSKTLNGTVIKEYFCIDGDRISDENAYQLYA